MSKKIIVIGAGPAGLSFTRSLRDTDIEITLLEKQPENVLQNPSNDGRDIALTHLSKSILENLEVWERFSTDEVSPLKAAKVMDGCSPYALHFNCHNNNNNVSELGYLVPNHVIRKALYHSIENQVNVNLIANNTVKSIYTDHNQASVVLEDETILRADLVIAADSRFSSIRRKMGISASMEEFGRTIIVCRVRHEKHHQHTAYECFHYGGTLAILPFTNNQSSIVITTTENKADELLAMNEVEFTHYVQQELRGKLGDIQLSGERYSYPLVAVYANQFISTRFALLGDAAVGMHPVTAHGFNLGLRGQHTLSRLILQALANHSDIGASSLLKTYQAEHRRASKPIYLGTNAIVKLYTNDSIPTKWLRKGLLRFSNHFPPIKHAITRQLTALSS